jgi:hypothetical protein
MPFQGGEVSGDPLEVIQYNGASTLTNRWLFRPVFVSVRTTPCARPHDFQVFSVKWVCQPDV